MNQEIAPVATGGGRMKYKIEILMDTPFNNTDLDVVLAKLKDFVWDHFTEDAINYPLLTNYPSDVDREQSGKPNARNMLFSLVPEEEIKEVIKEMFDKSTRYIRTNVN